MHIDDETNFISDYLFPIGKTKNLYEKSFD